MKTMAQLYQMKSDRGRLRCYAWEQRALPDGPHCDQATVRALVALVHSDVTRLVGPGAAHDTPIVNFLIRREGAASARWGALNFHPKGATTETVLHEISHSLTWCRRYLATINNLRQQGSDPHGVLRHLDQVLCEEGHGPRFKACLLGLMERYCGTDIGHALNVAQDGFRYAGTARAPLKAGPATVRVKIDMAALAYWRYLWTR